MMKRLAMVVVVAVMCVSAATAGQLRPDEKRALEAKPAVALVVVQSETKWTLGDISVIASKFAKATATDLDALEKLLAQ